MGEKVIPGRVYEHLRAGFVVNEAHDTLNRLIDHGYRVGSPVLLGSRFGNVLAWMWRTAPDEVGMFIADFMAQLRHHDALVGEGCPRVRFDDVLGSLPAALPNEIEATGELIDHLRSEVPKYFGSDLNS